MIPSLACPTPDECCDVFYSIAAHLLSEVYDALIVCYPESCIPLTAYVTLGPGNDGIVDALSVAVQSITPSPNNSAGQLGLWRGLFMVELAESGWPTAHIEGETIVLPDPVSQAVAAQHVMAMGEAMHRKLARLQQIRGLTPDGVRCSNATVGTMVPRGPSAGVVGWRAPVTIDLPWN